jgi:hypothetical protein
VGQATAGGEVNWDEVGDEAIAGAKRGAVDAGTAFVTAGAGELLGVGAQGATRVQNVVRGAGAGSAGGSFGGFLGATLEGKSADEVFEATLRGGAVGAVGGAAGGVFAGGPATQSTTARAAGGAVGGFGGGAAEEWLAGGSWEDVLQSGATAGLIGAVTSTTSPGRGTGITEVGKPKPGPRSTVVRQEEPLVQQKQGETGQTAVAEGEVTAAPTSGAGETADVAAPRQGPDEALQQAGGEPLTDLPAVKDVAEAAATVPAQTPEQLPATSSTPTPVETSATPAPDVAKKAVAKRDRPRWESPAPIPEGGARAGRASGAPGAEGKVATFTMRSPTSKGTLTYKKQRTPVVVEHRPAPLVKKPIALPDAKIAEARALRDRALKRHEQLPARLSEKTVASARQEDVISGFDPVEMPDAPFTHVGAPEVSPLLQQLEHTPASSGYSDRPGVGAAHSVHAELKQATKNPGEPQGVSRPMCADCQLAFSKRTTPRGFAGDQVIADPDAVRIFAGDGTYIEISEGDLTILVLRPDGSATVVPGGAR